MRRHLTSCVIFALCSGAAFAQAPEPFLYFYALEGPLPADREAVLPAAAKSGSPGAAVLSCRPSNGRLVDCKSEFEAPAGAGFGAAALALAPKHRVYVDENEGPGRILFGMIFPSPRMNTRPVRVPEPVLAPGEPRPPPPPPPPAPPRRPFPTVRVVIIHQCAILPSGRVADCKLAYQKNASPEQLEDTMAFAASRAYGPSDRAGGAAEPVFMMASLGPGKRVSVPAVVRGPTAAEMLDVFPIPARRARTNGRVNLQCQVTKTGGLAECRVANETPAGMGFGQAALKLTPKVVMKPLEVDGKPVEGAPVTVPFVFAVT